MVVLRPVASALALVATVAAAFVAWATVVDRLRSPEPIEIHGRPAAIVWGGRVFRNERQLAAWFTSRGKSYERWARNHPDAVAILRPATRGDRASARAAAASAPQPAKAKEGGPSTAAVASVAASAAPRESRLPAEALIVPILALIALMVVVGASVPTRLVAASHESRIGSVAALAARHRLYLIASGMSIALGVLVSAAS